MEKRKKVASQIRNEILLNTKMEREQHETQLRDRLKDSNKKKKQEMNKKLKCWEEERKAIESKMPSQICIDRLQILKETNNDRMLNHKVNLARCKRKQ